MKKYDPRATAEKQFDIAEQLENHTPAPHIQLIILLGIGNAILSVADELRELRRRSW